MAASLSARSMLEWNTPQAANSTAEIQRDTSLTLFLVLSVTAVCIVIIHCLIKFKVTFLPESVAVVAVGALAGLMLQLVGNWRKEEAFPPMIFFLMLLPPIIFESGYNMRKGNFFHNIGSILTFSLAGTAISAGAIGGGLFLLGRVGAVYQLSLLKCFAFGSLISAIDPVATLAIFQATKVDQVLYMLVFGESILNDAISIVLMTIALQLDADKSIAGLDAFKMASVSFLKNFVGAGSIGVAFGLTSALLLKWIDLRKTPSLEIGIMLIFSYAPYCLAESLHLSGIMTILFAGIVMSHYTHRNLSSVTQITAQHTFRTLAFLAETLVFAYLGLAIFSFQLNLQPTFIISCIALCFLGRACNIFPLSLLLNLFRRRRIECKSQFIMWFSGLRGAIAFALALQLQIDKRDRSVLVSSTLVIVLFTIIVLGGGTLPLVRCLTKPPSLLLDGRSQDAEGSQQPQLEASLSKTNEFGSISNHHSVDCPSGEFGLSGLERFDTCYIAPFFTRAFTQLELEEGEQDVQNLTDQWHHEVRCESASAAVSVAFQRQASGLVVLPDESGCCDSDDKITDEETRLLPRN